MMKWPQNITNSPLSFSATEGTRQDVHPFVPFPIIISRVENRSTDWGITVMKHSV